MIFSQVEVPLVDPGAGAEHAAGETEVLIGEADPAVVPGRIVPGHIRRAGIAIDRRALLREVADDLVLLAVAQADVQGSPVWSPLPRAETLFQAIVDPRVAILGEPEEQGDDRLQERRFPGFVRSTDDVQSRRELDLPIGQPSESTEVNPLDLHCRITS